ncbi:MAG: hypothetical protein K2L94_00515 [Alphaproteobacteria bacterium]|nr:hypothetical protein [Alphaproteobacteria bacterium]
MYAKSQVSKLCERLRLTPYQSYILEMNCHKYNLSRLVKRGGVLYAPYLSGAKNRWTDAAARLVRGPRADLIGPDRMLVRAQRGIRFCADGCYCARHGGVKYYADATGRRLTRDDFMRIVTTRPGR